MSGNATPLIGLDAVVMDTETTGLDPAKSRLIEVAAVTLIAGKLDADAPFRHLVDCGGPVPAAAVAIHGIDNAMLSGAPGFADIWPALQDFIGDRVVIGHTLGFDLAVLKRECERTGIVWRRPRTLDTKLLAEAVHPNLAGFGLDQLAAFFEIAVAERHRALADAIVTAQVFLALLPGLRERGIRTLAEAELACRTLTTTLDDQYRAGWTEAVAAPLRDEESALARVDTYPYRHRIATVMSAPPHYATPTETIGAVLGQMAGAHISSLLVYEPRDGDAAPLPAQTAIVTERDILRALAEHGAPALALPVERIASRPLAAVPADAFIYRAIGRMNRLNVRHLGVTDGNGRLCGALSARDLLRLRAQEAVALGDAIDEARDVGELARAWAALPRVARALVAENVPGRDIAAVISRELGAATRRAAVLAEATMLQNGQGGPPCAYAVAVLGSGGRGESLLAMDQDNALIFAEGEPDGAADRWFAVFAGHIADILHQVGVPNCPGGVMAKNPAWRGSLDTWRVRLAHWISRSNAADLLSVDIFFDLRAVHGDLSLAESIWRHGFELARSHADFAKLLAQNSGNVESGLNLLGGIRTDQGRIDLKKCGLFGIVSAARILAIRHHVAERSTPLRLSGIAALRLGGASDLAALADAHATFVDLILAQQLEDSENGLAPSNKVAVKPLTRKQRDRLRTALSAMNGINVLTRDLLF